jgi:hypothetical protein
VLPDEIPHGLLSKRTLRTRLVEMGRNIEKKAKPFLPCLEDTKKHKIMFWSLKFYFDEINILDLRTFADYHLPPIQYGLLSYSFFFFPSLRKDTKKMGAFIFIEPVEFISDHAV